MFTMMNKTHGWCGRAGHRHAESGHQHALAYALDRQTGQTSRTRCAPARLWITLMCAVC